jgi:hypothetical protein
MRFVLSLTLLLCTPLALAADYGEPLPDPLLPIALADALGDPDIDASAQVYAGTIKQVCQHEGCWMILADGAHWARVQTHHRFAIPKDATGTAIVWGSLSEVEVPADEAPREPRESGISIEAMPGRPMTEYRIDARGVRIETETKP